jgi:hypothetical protein
MLTSSSTISKYKRGYVGTQVAGNVYRFNHSTYDHMTDILLSPPIILRAQEGHTFQRNAPTVKTAFMRESMAEHWQQHSPKVQSQTKQEQVKVAVVKKDSKSSPKKKNNKK